MIDLYFRKRKTKEDLEKEIKKLERKLQQVEAALKYREEAYARLARHHNQHCAAGAWCIY